jgi:hypothetical protein
MGSAYEYVRPNATIKPTAIFFGLSVNVNFGFSDTDGLRAAIEEPIYSNAIVIVALKHGSIVRSSRHTAAIRPSCRSGPKSILTASMSSRSAGPETPQKRLSHTSMKTSTDSRTPVPADASR